MSDIDEQIGAGITALQRVKRLEFLLDILMSKLEDQDIDHGLTEEAVDIAHDKATLYVLKKIAGTRLAN